MKKFEFVRGLMAATALTMLLPLGGAAFAQDAIKVGMAVDLTGPSAGANGGAVAKEAFDLAIEMLDNKLGGIPAEFVVVDNGGNPEQARQVVDRMIKLDKIELFTGPTQSNVALAVGPVLFDSEIPYISTNAGPRGFSGANCNPYFFSVSWQNDDLPSVAGAMANDAGYKRMDLLTYNYAAGKEVAESFGNNYKGEIVNEIFAKLGQSDFGAEIAQVRADNPDAIFAFMAPQFFKQYLAAGVSPDIDILVAGYHADQAMDVLGDAIVGFRNPSQWSFDLPNEANKAFVENYKKKYGRNPTMQASQAYDAIMLMDSAVREVGGNVKDKAALLAAIKAAKFESVRGSFKFGPDQFPIQNFYLRVVEKGADGVIVNKLLKPEPIVADYENPNAKNCPAK